MKFDMNMKYVTNEQHAYTKHNCTVYTFFPLLF